MIEVCRFHLHVALYVIDPQTVPLPTIRTREIVKKNVMPPPLHQTFTKS